MPTRKLAYDGGEIGIKPKILNFLKDSFQRNAEGLGLFSVMFSFLSQGNSSNRSFPSSPSSMCEMRRA